VDNFVGPGCGSAGHSPVVVAAFSGCTERFEPFVGLNYDSSSLDIFAIYPTRESWNEQSDRHAEGGQVGYSLRRKQDDVVLYPVRDEVRRNDADADPHSDLLPVGQVEAGNILPVLA
jgi:hypothetical protein